MQIFNNVLHAMIFLSFFQFLFANEVCPYSKKNIQKALNNVYKSSSFLKKVKYASQGKPRVISDTHEVFWDIRNIFVYSQQHLPKKGKSFFYKFWRRLTKSDNEQTMLVERAFQTLKDNGLLLAPNIKYCLLGQEEEIPKRSESVLKLRKFFSQEDGCDLLEAYGNKIKPEVIINVFENLIKLKNVVTPTLVDMSAIFDTILVLSTHPEISLKIPYISNYGPRGNSDQSFFLRSDVRSDFAVVQVINLKRDIKHLQKNNTHPRLQFLTENELIEIFPQILDRYLDQCHIKELHIIPEQEFWRIFHNLKSPRVKSARR